MIEIHRPPVCYFDMKKFWPTFCLSWCRLFWSYEEFGGNQDYSNCLTCQGIGRVPRSQLEDLMALVPCNDDRLKPKRTALWVSMGVIVAFITCGAVAGLMTYFLLPRYVDVHMVTPTRNGLVICPNQTEPICVSRGQKRIVFINMTVPLVGNRIICRYHSVL